MKIPHHSTPTPGVFAITLGTSPPLIQFAARLYGQEARNLADLRRGGHPCKRLQAQWPAAYRFEVLELTDDATRLEHWITQLNGFPIKPKIKPIPLTEGMLAIVAERLPRGPGFTSETPEQRARILKLAAGYKAGRAQAKQRLAANIELKRNKQPQPPCAGNN